MAQGIQERRNCSVERPAVDAEPRGPIWARGRRRWAVTRGIASKSLYAACMLRTRTAEFIPEFSALRLGSGPRGRRFKSSRPDQLFPKTLAILDRRGRW